jgi:deoxyribonuclease V
MQAAMWQGGTITPAQARQLQLEMAEKVITTGDVIMPHYIAGADISARRGSQTARAAVVVLSYPALELKDVASVVADLHFPYIPGLLSFREMPLVLAAFRKLSLTPDLLLVDGQGLAHPRRMGIACHLGLLLDIPTIGCAKSRLCGQHNAVGEANGSKVELLDGTEVIGTVLRSKNGSKPLYISAGHKISLENAVLWVSRCLRGYRLPEPPRLAHLAAGGNLQVN